VNKKTSNILRILVSAFLFSFLIIRNFNNFKNVPDLLRNLDISFLILGVFFYFLGISGDIFKLDILLRAQNIVISKKYLFKLLFIGFFFNNLLPTTVGGDAYRIYDLSKNKKVPVSKSISAVFLGRFMGMLSGFFYLIYSFSFGMYKYLNKYLVISLLIVFFLTFILIAILTKPNIFRVNILFKKFKFLSNLEEEIKSFYKILRSYRYKIKSLSMSLFYSLLLQMLIFISFYFISFSIGINLGIVPFTFIVPVTSTVSNIPISIGGIGIRENTLIFLLKEFSVTESKALTFSIIVLITILLLAMFGGLVYIVKNIFLKPKGVI